MTRQIAFNEAIRESLDQSMEMDESVYVMALGAPDPRGIFGTTLGLQEKYGPKRVMDMPTAENAMTGVAIGSALSGQRPVLIHQRLDFALLSVEQIVNQAAKWHYMFSGQSSVPLVIRMIVGRGWGQGPQHSQSLQSWFAHIPGLKVIMPSTPEDAKGLTIAAIKDNNPVISLEHRWLYDIEGEVDEKPFSTPIGKARIAKAGDDITVVATSFMVVEALRAATYLDNIGISVEVVDLRTISPLDKETVLTSVRKTGRLLVTDTGWTTYGIGAEIVALVAEEIGPDMKSKPKRVALPDVPTPTTNALADELYPRAEDLVRNILDSMGASSQESIIIDRGGVPLDIPGNRFVGPF